MGKALFYHLTRAPLEETARVILARALAQGWRVCLRGRTPEQLAALDAALWLGDKAAFLPHGLAGGPHDADQPILLTTAPGCPNGAQALMAVDQADITPEDCAQAARVWVLFDGHDAAALEHARAQWRTLAAAGVAAEYWSEETGRWQKMRSTEA